jgi:hypothetical protein
MWMQSPALWRMYVAWMLPGGGGEIERRRGTTPEPPSDGDDGGRSGKAVRGVVVRQEGG